MSIFQASGPNLTRRRLGIRAGVLVAALVILFLRMPTSFTNPQFWAEDNGFFHDVRLHGWQSLFFAPPGYLETMQYLVAVLASYLSPVAAPTIYNYSAILLTLMVVWLVSSPRLVMPYKPLLAIAVVIVPMGFEELGTITNIQWVLPIGAFALLFMSPSTSAVTRAGEVILIVLTALSGPFSIFLTPLFLWRLLTARAGMDKRRLTLLTTIVGLGALTQLLVIAAHYGQATDPASAVPYPWTLWINLPFTQIMTTFGPVSRLFNGVAGFFFGLTLLAVATALARIGPYRTQKVFMLIFALAIAFSGMYKFRTALGGQLGAQRYFYVGAVFSLWYLCCLTDSKYWRKVVATSVALIEIGLLSVVTATPRVQHDFEWPVWSRYIPSGLPIVIPSTPNGFYLGFPAAAEGPLSGFRDWLGQDITRLANDIDQTYCSGDLGRIVRLDILNLQTSVDAQRSKGWMTSGSAWDASHERPVQLVVLVDQNNRVTGFGFPGFKQPAAKVGSAPASGWNSIFYAEPGSSVHAYGIVDDGQRLCPLANEHGFPPIDLPLASGDLLDASALLPGKTVTQRFKPLHRLEGMSVRFVNFGQRPSSYDISWRITGSRGGPNFELGSGTIDAGAVGDWQIVELPLSVFPKDVLDEIDVSFKANTDVPPAFAAGLPLYRPLTATTARPAEIGGVPANNGGQLDLLLSYSP